MARVILVSDEILGYTRTGGIGTATSFLALALARTGHGVEILYAADAPRDAPAGEWARLYDAAGVSIRTLHRSRERVEPSYFGRMRDVEQALAAEPPDVVIVQDLAAPAYTALRLRSLGLAFENTLFVVYCHGTRQWITDAARKVRVLPGALAITNLERASIELADVVVSPSAYLVDWMRAQGWQLPGATHVIPHLTRATALGEPQPRPAASGGRISRIIFFGRLEERKGIRPFVDGVNALPPPLAERVEVEFLGRATPAWNPTRIRSLLRDDLSVSFSTDLDQPEALARLARPGTLAVMPSYEETFGNTVRECLDYGIPFIASDVAAIRELVAPEDRDRVLFEPTAEGIARSLRQALERDAAWPIARPAFDPSVAVTQWSRLVDIPAQPPATEETDPTAFELLLDDGDEPDDELRATLARAQQVSGADVVTCGVRLPDGTAHMFHGQPRALGLLANHYGTVAFIRRSLIDDTSSRWQLLARLAADGADIVSVPLPLATTAEPPATLARNPDEALRVAQELERVLPDSARGLARLTAGLAGAAAQPSPLRAGVPAQTPATTRARRAVGAAIGIASRRALSQRRPSTP